MKRDFKTVITLLAFSLPVLAIVFIGAIYFGNCGLNTDCSRADLVQVIHTPIPTLIAATLPVPTPAGPAPAGTGKCSVAAEPLLAAWVGSGYSDTAPFGFTDANGANCQATFADVQPLFIESNLWYSGALACASCHNANIAAASAHMDLSSYAGMLAGGNRTTGSAKGDDLFGGGNWDQSKLDQMLFVLKLMPFGRPAGAVADQGPTILAGTQVAATTPPEETEVAARPSNGGGPGQAVNLSGDPTAGAVVYQSQCAICHGDKGTGGVPNPGSTDGTVPPLNPIDSTLVSADYTTYATNLDLFIQHGSDPEGTNPFRSMPAWGDQNALTQQQIADVIAYIIGLNPAPAATGSPTPTEETEVAARPSNSGGPGQAINLSGDPTAGAVVYQSQCSTCHGVNGLGGIPNPGSTDGTVPPLNPIDSTLVSADYTTYATNLDLFIQHGSDPEGTNPFRSMPAWGDQNALTQQQIADVIAFIIGLNPASPASASPTPTEETEVAARPSNSGGPGQAVNLNGDPTAGAVVYQSQCSTCHGDKGTGGVPNPGSTDGTVPPLNPIDSTLVSPDYTTYATNLDLFIQHGSDPEGTSPFRNMPAWGDQNALTQQQIADVIAYIISLNK